MASQSVMSLSIVYDSFLIIFDKFRVCREAARPLIVDESSARMRNEGGSFTASIYGRYPKVVFKSPVTSHLSYKKTANRKEVPPIRSFLFQLFCEFSSDIFGNIYTAVNDCPLFQNDVEAFS